MGKITTSTRQTKYLSHNKRDCRSFSAGAKVDALNSFINEVAKSSNGKFCIAGASLGGAASIDVAATNPNCAGLVLIDAQGFVDGIGPMSVMPKPVARLGVEVLSTFPTMLLAGVMVPLVSHD